ncbi:MAG: SdpI family protein [Actinomycetota bacterium]
MRKPWVGWIAIVGAFAFSLATYSRLSERVPIHWNIEFEPNGYASKLTAALGLPLLMLSMPVIVAILVKIDPRRTSHELHRDTLWAVINLVIVMLGALHVLVLGLALGWRIDSARAFSILIGGLFVGIGNLLPRIRPNWFFGIRTPWTLSSDDVWRQTHRLGAWASIAGGLLLAIAGFQPVEWFRSAAWIASIGLIAAVPIVYSYVIWMRLGRPRRGARA